MVTAAAGPRRQGSCVPEGVPPASAIPNLADDDTRDELGAAESTLVGTLTPPEDTLVGTLPKAPGIEDDADDTGLDSTLVGDPWDTTEVTGRPSEVRALRPTAPASAAPPVRTGKERAAPQAKAPAAKPVAPKTTPKRTVPRASTKPCPAPATSHAAKPEVPTHAPAIAPPPPPVIAPPPMIAPPPAVTAPPIPELAQEPLDHTAPYLSASPPPLPVGADADDDASFRRLSAGPFARMTETLFAVVLFVAYLGRDVFERLVSFCRPLWARASRDAAAHVYRRR